VSWKLKSAFIGVSSAALFVFVMVGQEWMLTSQAKGAAQAESESAVEKQGQALADSHLSQWKRKNPDRVADWVAEEKERHTIQPPADNSDLLKGGQGKGHSYGQYTELDILTWARETEKMVVEGSRIFHDAAALGGTVGVSCDMCHPHAANTHPETYPKFQAQLGRVVLLRDIINWCIENPVRGQRFEADDARMRALEAYIYAQRKGFKLDYGKH
jgi:thiosulfate dehydrogenase